MWTIRVRRRAGVAILGSIWSMLSLCARADDPLTLAEAQRLALQRSEKLIARQFELAAANELTVAADQLADPVLQMGVENVPVSGPDSFTLDKDSMTMTRVGVMQEFTRGEKRRLRAERATLSVAMAEAEQAETQAKVERATALAWFDAYFAARRTALVNVQLVEAQSASTAAESAFAQGRKTAADAIAERAMVVEAQDQVAAASIDERKTRIVLARWIGDAAQRPLHQAPAVDALPLHGHENLAALEAALREHPDIVLLDKQLELARTDAALARAERQSDWSMELSYGFRGSQFDDMVTLGVSIPLQLRRGSRQDREIAARLAMASAAKAQRDDLYREHVTEVRAMLDEWNVMRQRLERYRNEMTPLAKDRVLASEAAYRGGKAMVEEWLAARRNELSVQLEVLQMERELARLWAELSFLGETNRVASAGPGPSPHPSPTMGEGGKSVAVVTRLPPAPSPVVGEGGGEGSSFGVSP